MTHIKGHNEPERIHELWTQVQARVPAGAMNVVHDMDCMQFLDSKTGDRYEVKIKKIK